MQTRIICCKLMITPEIEEALTETSKRFADACNHVLKQALADNTSNALKLHQLCYAKVREQTGLSANLTVRSIRRVSAMMTRLKGKRKAPRGFLPKEVVAKLHSGSKNALLSEGRFPAGPLRPKRL